jgi:hypothetical protein
MARSRSRTLPLSTRVSITAAHLLTPPGSTHRLRLSVVHLDGSGWQPEPVLHALRQATAILSQCDVAIVAVEWVSLAAPPRYLDFSTPVARELVRLHPVAKPTIYLVRATANRRAYDAEAFGRANTPTRPELADTVWVAVGARDLGIVLAHELAHVLMDSGEHSDGYANLMRSETSPANTTLSVTQCARLRETHSRTGFCSANPVYSQTFLPHPCAPSAT